MSKLKNIVDLNKFLYRTCLEGSVITGGDILSEWDDYLNRIYSKLSNEDTLSTLPVEDVLLLAITFCYRGNQLASDYIHNNVGNYPSRLDTLCEHNLYLIDFAYFNRNQWVMSYGKNDYNLQQLITETKTLRKNYEEIKKIIMGVNND